ncbi:hypothetical protein LTR53_006174 [Teratosphaeriaceae sp. CCFEE 6253]|nr:hypothetical protein LTR53_006174 [Teratosphaeriaceae sp. CCFEE 6253]
MDTDSVLSAGSMDGAARQPSAAECNSFAAQRENVLLPRPTSFNDPALNLLELPTEQDVEAYRSEVDEHGLECIAQELGCQEVLRSVLGQSGAFDVSAPAASDESKMGSTGVPGESGVVYRDRILEIHHYHGSVCTVARLRDDVPGETRMMSLCEICPQCIAWVAALPRPRKSTVKAPNYEVGARPDAQSFKRRASKELRSAVREWDSARAMPKISPPRQAPPKHRTPKVSG